MAGVLGNAQSPAYTYASAGTYIVKLTATDANGQSSSVTKSVTVAQGNPPVVGFTYQGDSTNPLKVTFIDASTQGNAAITAYHWDFGITGANSNLQNPTYTYPSAGMLTVTLIVTDANGLSSFGAKIITVAAPSSPLIR